MSTVIALPDQTTPRASVAAEVRAELGRARISGAKLSAIFGQSQAYWSRRISGKVAFDVDDLFAIADLLDIDVRRFFGGDRPNGPTGGAGGGSERTSSD